MFLFFGIKELQIFDGSCEPEGGPVWLVFPFIQTALGVFGLPLILLWYVVRVTEKEIRTWLKEKQVLRGLGP